MRTGPPDYRDGMGLFSAWVLITLVALVALGFAASAWRVARAERPGRAR
ncbi:hypothetical protein GCM10023328_01580 [Modestobacter marinus]|uniref:Uncharacterized protein n=2 Tax=Modestobacter marinus TaxID=477641 RepID=A0ABQ2FU97_9ACTN|nr:hypothetical protein GCM10011589_08380 [Modestobacter marinus]